MNMNKVRITAIRQTVYEDLIAKYEKPIEHTCDVREGQQWLSIDGQQPEGMCPSAWYSMCEFVESLARGEGNFYDGWMKNPMSAMISCNDGFRPFSFYLEVIECRIPYAEAGDAGGRTAVSDTMNMNKVRITAIRQTVYEDLIAKYEKPIEHTCDVREGQQWLSIDGQQPEGMCPSAWYSMCEFVESLARGEGNFYDGWMKNPMSAMISCNDGFRPFSFYLEVIE